MAVADELTITHLQPSSELETGNCFRRVECCATVVLSVTILGVFYVLWKDPHPSL